MKLPENKKEICKKLGYNKLKPCLGKLEYVEKEGFSGYLQKNIKYDFVLGQELFLKN